MSQFLVCFAEEDVVRLLERAAAAMTPQTRLYILDTFWDRQEHEASAFSLQAISLYFTFLANGRSRMYKASDIIRMLKAAGLEVEREAASWASALRCSLAARPDAFCPSPPPAEEF
jgi:hypothetical protein